MKCELCTFQEKPDNLNKLATHLEICPAENSTKATIVWRDAQITATMNPLENDMKFEVEIRDLPAAEEPEIVTHTFYEPQVEVAVIDNRVRGGQND